MHSCAMGCRRRVAALWRPALGILGALLVCLVASSAWPRMHHPARGHRILQSGAPLDGFTQPTGAYSFRRLRSAYAGPAIRIRRASDNAETDIGFLGFVPGLGAPIDFVAAGVHCAATNCFVPAWYDQSGNALHAVQLTPANQPPLVFNCAGTLPCMSSSDFRFLSVAGVTVAATKTLNMVGRRQGGTGTCQLATVGPVNNFIVTAAPNTWRLESLTGLDAPGAADGAWHAAVGVINGAASVLRIDATETAGTVTSGVAAGSAVYPVYAAAASVCSFAEIVYWDGYAMPAAERAALQANQKSFWGLP